MDDERSIRWMRLALRARICSQCDPPPAVVAPDPLPQPHSCESGCAFFNQLPRLARFLHRHRARPPVGYEEFAIQLLLESPLESGGIEAKLDYAHEALATMEKVVSLMQAPSLPVAQHDCVRRDRAMVQLNIQLGK